MWASNADHISGIARHDLKLRQSNRERGLEISRL
jgi:hypothetical protein